MHPLLTSAIENPNIFTAIPIPLDHPSPPLPLPSFLRQFSRDATERYGGKPLNLSSRTFFHASPMPISSACTWSSASSFMWREGVKTSSSGAYNYDALNLISSRGRSTRANQSHKTVIFIEEVINDKDCDLPNHPSYYHRSLLDAIARAQPK